jgi:riboflavin synthase alpha subunit
MEFESSRFESVANGNVLLIAWESKTRDEAVVTGRNPNFTAIDGICLTVVGFTETYYYFDISDETFKRTILYDGMEKNSKY